MISLGWCSSDRVCRIALKMDHWSASAISSVVAEPVGKKDQNQCDRAREKSGFLRLHFYAFASLGQILVAPPRQSPPTETGSS
jgi:hypothetical protein